MLRRRPTRKLYSQERAAQFTAVCCHQLQHQRPADDIDAVHRCAHARAVLEFAWIHGNDPAAPPPELEPTDAAAGDLDHWESPRDLCRVSAHWGGLWQCTLAWLHRRDASQSSRDRRIYRYKL